MLSTANVKPLPGEMSLLLLTVMYAQVNLLELAMESGQSFMENKGRNMEREVNVDRVLFITDSLQCLAFVYIIWL